MLLKLILLRENLERKKWFDSMFLITNSFQKKRKKLMLIMTFKSILEMKLILVKSQLIQKQNKSNKLLNKIQNKLKMIFIERFL